MEISVRKILYQNDFNIVHALEEHFLALEEQAGKKKLYGRTFLN